MFTGIIEEIGTINHTAINQLFGRIAISAHTVLEGTKPGDSIAVNGVCLTVTALHPDGFEADVMAETLRRSNLGEIVTGAKVNLERAMPADGRFGGHIVSGHIDSTGEITHMAREYNAVWITLKAPGSALDLIVEKGSIAIDGVSLTAAIVSDIDFKVSLVPHTGKETALLSKKPGDLVNLECDIIGKYIWKSRNKANGICRQSKITLDFLQQHGF